MLRGWEGGLLAIYILTMIVDTTLAPRFLSLGNQINIFDLWIEEIIVALPMTLIIVNAEIDLSVASVMGLAAAVFAYMVNTGWPPGVALVAALAIGPLVGAVNAALVTRVGIPSLVVTLAMMIGVRGLAHVIVTDRSYGNLPDWFTGLGQNGFLGPVPLAIWIFLLLLIFFAVLLHRTGFGRQVTVIGTNAEVARFSGLDVARVKTILFLASGTVSALAGLLYAARLGAVRGDSALGFELDIITMVLMGGVSIFGGRGSILGVFLSILIILNLRNGMSLMSITDHIQTGVVGCLLIGSVLLPNLVSDIRARAARRRNRA